MARRVLNGDGAAATDLNCLFRANEGYGVAPNETGTCAVSVGDDGSGGIEARTDGGTVAIDNTFVAVAAQTVALADGAQAGPRKDLVWVDRDGDLRVRPGEPATSVEPATADRWQTGVPALPDTASLDGVPLLGVYVRAGATAADLSPLDTLDLRVRAPRASGDIPELAADPPDTDLLSGRSRLWNNTTANELRFYDAETQDVSRVDTTQLRAVGSVGGGNDRIPIETFDTTAWEGNWSAEDYDALELTESGDAYAGDAALRYPSSSGGWAIWSFPGDGLGTYPQAGDTVSVALDASQGEVAWLGFGKETSAESRKGDCWRVKTDFDGGTLRITDADGFGSDDPAVAETSVSYPNGYVVLKVKYDANGDHTATAFDGTGGSKGSQLGTCSATGETKWSGRGVEIGGIYETNADSYDILR